MLFRSALSVASIAAAAVFVASVILTPFSGGSSLAVGFAAMGGIIAAAVGSYAVGKSVFAAVRCFQKGKTAEGFLNLGIAAVMAVTTIFGASSIANVGRSFGTGVQALFTKGGIELAVNNVFAQFSSTIFRASAIRGAKNIAIGYAIGFASDIAVQAVRNGNIDWKHAASVGGGAGALVGFGLGGASTLRLDRKSVV